MGLSIPANKLIKFLEEKGFEFRRANGTSHNIYRKGNISVSVPIHNGKDLRLGTLGSILKDAGYSKQDFEEWLGR